MGKTRDRHITGEKPRADAGRDQDDASMSQETLQVASELLEASLHGWHRLSYSLQMLTLMIP